MPGIFINYRREDSGGYAGRIYESLVAAFGKDRVFIDIDAIGPGENFPKVLSESIAQCNVLLALIGKRWVRQVGQDDRRRLDDPADFVRMEIASALRQGIRVIPVLVGGAQMPTEGELPPEIAELASRNAHELPDHYFNAGMAELIRVLREIVPKREWSRLRRRALLASGLLVGVGGIGLKLSGDHGSGTEKKKEEPKGPVWPKLEEPPEATGSVVVRTPPKVTAPPAVAGGDGAISTLHGANGVSGPKHPHRLWAARIMIGDTWSIAGIAPDGTVYLWDDEHSTLAGVSEGAERWAFYSQLTGVAGLDSEGRIWTQGNCCFNSKGEGGCLPQHVQVPAKLLRRTKDSEGVRCSEGQLVTDVWKFDLDGNCGSWDPVRDEEGNAYVATDRGSLFVVSAKGALLWKYAVKGRPGKPVFSDANVIIGDDSGLTALRGGTKQWSLAIEDASPAFADRDGVIYLGFTTKEGYVPAKNVGAVSADGRLLWALSGGFRELVPQGIDGQRRLYEKSDGAVYCLGD